MKNVQQGQSSMSSSGGQSSSTSGGEVNIRQNFHEENEEGLNTQIKLCIEASYMYQSMSFYFDQTDVALKGFSRFFAHISTWDMEDFAEKLMKYVNKRGGRVNLETIEKPKRQEWGTGLECMEMALDIERKLNENFLNLHKVALNNQDAHMAHFLEDFFLSTQIAWIRKIATYITRLKRVGEGIGEYLFDKELLLKYYTYEQTKDVIEASRKVVTPGQTIVPAYLPALLKGLNINIV